MKQDDEFEPPVDGCYCFACEQSRIRDAIWFAGENRQSEPVKKGWNVFDYARETGRRCRDG